MLVFPYLCLSPAGRKFFLYTRGGVSYAGVGGLGVPPTPVIGIPPPSLADSNGFLIDFKGFLIDFKGFLIDFKGFLLDFSIDRWEFLKNLGKTGEFHGKARRNFELCSWGSWGFSRDLLRDSSLP